MNAVTNVSIVTTCYNRAGLVGRAIESVLRQTRSDWELIVVDDGSTDGSQETIRRYAALDHRIQATFHERNMGVHAAKNSGLRLAKGEWFTTLDSDDEMLPHALERLLWVTEAVDSSYNAVTCNCIDSTTGVFSGIGLDKTGLVTFESLISKARGEHWGITKRCLLEGREFSEGIIGGAEDTLWYAVSKRAKRYYLHEALRIYHTEGEDRLCVRGRSVDISKRSAYYISLQREHEYLEQLARFRPADYALILRRIVVAKILSGERKAAISLARKVGPAGGRGLTFIAICGALLGPRMMRRLVSLTQKLR